MKQFKILLCGIVVAGAQIAVAQSTFNPVPSNLVGQPTLTQSGSLTNIAPNLVEGRELWAPQALAVDNSAKPPILYVSDYLNNRVLAWKNASGFTKGDPADLVIGQRDKFTTAAKGPGSDLSTGLNLPTGLVVDSSGNLFVADTGNNRIIRYPAPFQQTSSPLTPDLLLGQKSLTGRSANQGSSPSATTLSLQGQFIGLAIDSSGNLWVSDGNNNRVLRYPVASLAANSSFDPAADVVLGQPDFTTTTTPTGFTRISKNGLSQPGALAFAPTGELYVADSSNRVAVYVGPFTSGQTIARLMGIPTTPQNGPAPVGFSATTLGAVSSNGAAVPPDGIFFIGNNPFVVDTGVNRILEYPPFGSWPSEVTAFSPSAIEVFGQPDFTSSQSNNGSPQPSASTLNFPTQAALAGTDLIVVDSGNNRVIAIPQFPTLAGGSSSAPGFTATRILGQVDFKYNSKNLIEGREFDLFDSQDGSGGGVAIDTSSSTPHMYVADTFNHRVLGFNDARKVKPGQTADLVIGQPDFYTAVINYPSGDTQHFSASGLFLPETVAVDSAGNLWVADAGNGRVLRFASPFAQTQTALQTANLVLGKAYVVGTNDPDASSVNMRFPYGIAFALDGSVAVSDFALNRILYFQKPAGGDFTNGQTATSVIGQPDFGTSTNAELNQPRGLAIDGSNRLYVADTSNNRVLIYPNIATSGSDPAPSLILKGSGASGDGFNAPFSIAIDHTDSEIWVADTGNGRIVRFPTYDTLVINPLANMTMSSSLMTPPLSVALDAFGNPVVAEAGNRVAFYYRIIGNNSGNSANYFYRFSPGMLASLFSSANSTFGTQTVPDTAVPIPTTLGDVQVLVNGVASPLLYVSPTQINFQIPSATPSGSTPVQFEVIRASTNQVLAAGLFRIDPFSPGLFTADASGHGQIAALNQDNSVNSSSKPAKAGSTIQLFATGSGVVPGAPPDGQPVSGLITTPITPTVFINGASATVSFSGLAPNYVGVWQINAVIPATVPPSQVSVVIDMNGFISSQDPFGNRITTTIYTTP